MHRPSAFAINPKFQWCFSNFKSNIELSTPSSFQHFKCIYILIKYMPSTISTHLHFYRDYSIYLKIKFDFDFILAWLSTASTLSSHESWYCLFIHILVVLLILTPKFILRTPLPMRLFSAAAGAKSSAHFFIPATTNCGVSPTPSPLHFPLHPLKLSLDKSDLSIFRNRYTLYERNAIAVADVFRHRRFVPSAISRVPFRGDAPLSVSSSSKKKVAVVAWSVLTLAVAVANRVLQKLALVPMKDYPFFLAQLNSFAYVFNINILLLHLIFYIRSKYIIFPKSQHI